MQHGVMKSNVDNGVFVVSTSASITDHGSTAQSGSFAWTLARIASTLGATAKAKIIFPANTTYTFISNVTVSAYIDVEVLQGAYLTGAVTLTFGGEIEAPRTLIFGPNVTAIFSAGTSIFPQWWYDGAGNYSTALGKAFTALAATSRTTLDLGGYTYPLTTSGINVTGLDYNVVTGDKALINYTVGSGNAIVINGANQCIFRGFELTFSGTANGIYCSNSAATFSRNTFDSIVFNGTAFTTYGSTRSSLMFDGTSGSYVMWENNVTNCKFMTCNNHIYFGGTGYTAHATDINSSNTFDSYYNAINVNCAGNNNNLEGQFGPSNNGTNVAYCVLLQGTSTGNNVTISGNPSNGYCYPYYLATGTYKNKVKVTGTFTVQGYNYSTYHETNRNEIEESMAFGSVKQFFQTGTLTYLEPGQSRMGYVYPESTPIDLATTLAEGIYKIYLNIISSSSSTVNHIMIYPNYTSYASAFSCWYNGSSSTGSSTASNFMLVIVPTGGIYLPITCEIVISTHLQSKQMSAVIASRAGVTSSISTWFDTTTPWTSFGYLGLGDGGPFVARYTIERIM